MNIHVSPKAATIVRDISVIISYYVKTYKQF